MTPRNKRRSTWILFLVFYSCLAITPSTGRSGDKEGRRRNDRLSKSVHYTSTPPSVNQFLKYGTYHQQYQQQQQKQQVATYSGPRDNTSFCFRHRDMKLMCYCTPEEHNVPVAKAECWVMSETLEDDLTWTRFLQQLSLKEVMIVVQKHGRMDYIPTKILQYLHNLTGIHIEYAQVEIVPTKAFASLQYLERISLNFTSIAILKQEAFAGHIRLKELQLDHNQITEIDKNAFHTLPYVERLYLNNNNISRIHDGTFSEMPRLVYLELSYNMLSVVTTDMFRGLSNVKILKLTNNKLNFIGNTVFTELWSLEEMDLDENAIERISERAFDGLNGLRKINLRKNYIQKLDNGVFRATPALLTLNIQDNLLETLSYYTFQAIMKNLVNGTGLLLLSENKFVCDCRLQWVFELRNQTRHEQLRDALRQLICTLRDPDEGNFKKPIASNYINSLNGFNRKSSNISKKPIQQLQQLQLQKAVDVDEEQQRLRKRSTNLIKFDNVDLLNKQISLRYDYYDESGQQPEQQEAQPSQYQHQHQYQQQYQQQQQQPLINDVIMPNTNRLDDDNAEQHNYQQEQTFEKFEMRVRLVDLKPESLPCPVEYSDPTELPLSRDLMDVRSNDQDLNPKKSKAPPTKAKKINFPQMVMAAGLIFVSISLNFA